jgi:PAS domain S-box-containing protein
MTNHDHEAAATALYGPAFEQAPAAFIVADVNGAIRLWNASAYRLFGFTAAEAVGSSLDIIIPERFRGAHWTGFRKAVTGGVTKYEGQVLTTRAQHKHGRVLYVDLTFALLKDAQETILGVLAIAGDCTESYLSRKAARGASAGTPAQEPSSNRRNQHQEVP